MKNPRLNEPEHPASYQLAQSTGKYYGIPIDNYVINYRKTNPTQANDMTGYNAFAGVQFAFGIARGGTHNFMYSKSSVFEVHWEKDGADLYERTAFYDWKWLSGLMVAPPECK